MTSFRRMWLAGVLAGTCFAAQAQIVIGQTAGFTSAVSAGVKETTEGARLYLDSVNSHGGVHGQPVELVSLDDRFEPALAVTNARTLIVDKQVLALFLSRGTPQTEALIPLLDQYGVALVGPSTGAMVLHRPVRKRVFNVRATYQREAEKAVSLLHSMGVTRIAVVHVDNSFGADALAGARNGLAAAGLQPVALEKLDESHPEFTAIAARVARAEPQAVLLLVSGSALVDGTRALRAAGVTARVVTLSNNASSGVVKSLGELARGMIVTQVFPDEHSIAYPLVKEALDLARANGGTTVSPAMLEGFSAAKVLVEALRRAGPKPTRERVQVALEGMRNVDLGGLDLSYSPTDHTGLDFADLSIIGSDGRFKR